VCIVGEQCDDGNLIDNDGCDSNCRVSDVCGNGIISAGEQCDDGNVFNGDGCSSACLADEDCEPVIEKIRISNSVRLRNTTTNGNGSLKANSVTVIATLGAAPGRSCPNGTTLDSEVRLSVRAGGSGSALFEGTIDTDGSANPLQLTSGSSTRLKFDVEFDAADCNGPIEPNGSQAGTLEYDVTAEVTQVGFDLGDTANAGVSGSLLCKP
jgi:cysteine-rich repeat protein